MGVNQAFVFEVDPRVELVAALEALARGNPCPAGENSQYLEAVRRGLDAAHPACPAFAAMETQDWRHLHPSLVILDFTPPPRLAVNAHFDHYGERGRDDALARLLPLLRRFAVEGRFMEFFASQGDFYESILSAPRRRFGSLDFAGGLTRYLGLPLPQFRYHFVISPLLHGPNPHNLLYQREGGAFEIYSVSGHERVSEGRPRFAFRERDFLRTAWHELAHMVVDGITKEFRAQIEPLAPLYGLMRGFAKAKYCGPPGWLHMVDEHLIRAITARLEADSFGEGAGRASVEKERADGFALIGPVYQSLIEYERERSRYPTLRDFYARLIEVLRGIYSGARPAAGW